MYRRHDEVPVYQRSPAQVPAEQFNLVHTALRHHHALRLPLPKLQNLALILQPDGWIVVDESLGDLPVLAWCEFPSRRTNLHQPVTCSLRLYHTHATLLPARVLEALALLVGELGTLPDGKARVLPFSRSKPAE